MTPGPTHIKRALAHRLETSRLILRLFREEDFEDLFDIVSDPETFRLSERGPMESEEAWTRLLRNIGHWDVKGYGLFAVEEKESGRLIGEAGLADFHRELDLPFGKAPEASWTISRGTQRRGYATEAAEAILAWAEGTLGIRRTICLIHSKNVASLRVARKVGYKAVDKRKYKGYPALLLERTHEPFLSDLGQD